MTEICGSNVISPKSEGEFDELDHVPLIHRKKLLLSRKKQTSNPPMPHIHVVKKEDESSNSQGVVSLPFDWSVNEGTDQQLAQQKSRSSEVSCEVNSGVVNGEVPVDFSAVGQRSQDLGTLGDFEGNNDVVALEKVDFGVQILPQDPMPSIPAKVKDEFSDGKLLCSLGDGINGSTDSDVPAVMVKNNILNDSTDDELDHIVLKERQQMLLRRKLSGFPKPVLEGNSIGMSQEIVGHCAKRLKEDIRSVDGESSMAGNQFNDGPARNASDLWRSSVDVPSNGITAEPSFTANWHLPKPGYSLGTEAIKSRNDMEESDKICSSKTSVKFNSCNGQDYVPASIDSMNGHDYVPARMNSMQSSTLPTSVNVKVEPVVDNGLHNSDRNALANFSFKTLRLKSEPEVPDELDMVDHMQLLDRMKLLTSVEDFELNTSRNFECLSKIMPPDLEVSPIVPESSKPGRVNRPRKRKKTATDSVETALEEDAPGLLQVLIDQGVSVDEIKLYGEPESDDALDESFNEDSFAELEAVMSKVFSQRTSLLKFAPLRCTKGSKPSYCVACLFSLVEQTRYLQFRNWPVEWGWCRDLQSFIFVFERHNRIVLERPEYGYATYFFELVDSLPINWQVKRLVTAMKLTSCGRITLIENKALMVGEDLTEGEARVLMEYGWIPNSGLGTMLNYCDRVVHDRKNEKDTSEWRSKIGKLLMDGYNGGSIVSSNIPKKVIDCRGAEIPQIKLEL